MASYIIDTNLIIRLATNDVPELKARAGAQLDQLAADSVELPLYVLSEASYVLGFNNQYAYSRDIVALALEEIIKIPQFSLNRDIAYHALETFAATKLDFVDCLLVAQNHAGNQTVLTFDKTLQQHLS